MEWQLIIVSSSAGFIESQRNVQVRLQIVGNIVGSTKSRAVRRHCSRIEVYQFSMGFDWAQRGRVKVSQWDHRVGKVIQRVERIEVEVKYAIRRKWVVSDILKDSRGERFENSRTYQQRATENDKWGQNYWHYESCASNNLQGQGSQ